MKSSVTRTLSPFLILVLLLLIPDVTAGQGTSWRKSASTSRGERTTSVSTTSINTVKSFGRIGRGTLTVSAYQSVPGMTVYTFAKVPKTAGNYVSLESWYDDDKPSPRSWIQLSDESTKITDIMIEMSRLLKAKTFNVRVTGFDGEKHLLTFNVQGLARHLDFLEIKAAK